MSSLPQSKVAVGFTRRLCASACLSGTGLGALVPLISSHLERAGSEQIWIGALATAYFAAQAVGAMLGRRQLQSRAGFSPLSQGLLVAALAAALFPWIDGFAAFSINRLIAGLAMGIYMTSAQLLVMQLDPARRAELSGYYALCFGVGFSLGPALGMNTYERSPELSFLLAALAFLAGALLMRRSGDQTHDTAQASEARLRVSRLALGAVFAYGFCEAALFAMFPVFWLQTGQPMEGLGLALGLFGIGSLLFVVPVGFCADKLGHEPVLSVCALLGAVCLTWLPFVEQPLLRDLLCGLAGAAIGPCFALALALLAARGANAQHSATFTAAFSVGSIAGPAVTAYSMRVAGARELFVPASALLVVLALAALTTVYARRPALISKKLGGLHD